MSLRENLSRFLRAFMGKRGISMSKLEQMVSISRNSLYAYINGEGNPTLATIDCLAADLHVDPAAIMLGVYDPEGQEASGLLLNTVKGVSGLTRAERQRFILLLIQEAAEL